MGRGVGVQTEGWVWGEGWGWGWGWGGEEIVPGRSWFSVGPCIALQLQLINATELVTGF